MKRHLPLLVTIGCVFVICGSVDLRQSLSVLRSVDVGFLCGVCAVAVLSRSMRTYKWRLLLISQGVDVTFWRAQAINWVGGFFAFWTPAGLGSDAYRLAVLSQDGQRHAVASTLVIERYAGLFSVCVVWMASLPITFYYLWRTSPRLALLLLLIPVACTGVLPLLLSSRLSRSMACAVPARVGRLREWLIRFADAIARYRRNWIRLVMFFILSVVEVISYVAINYLSARALGFHPPFLLLVCVMPAVYLLLRLPISIQGWGVQEGAMGFAVKLMGFDPSVGVAISLLQRVVEVMCFVIPGAVLASRRSAWSTTGGAKDAAADRI